MCHHFVIGLGFLIGPVLLSPFLPEGAGEAQQRKAACQQQEVSQDQEVDGGADPSAVSLEGMSWPFVLVSSGQVACGLAYLALIAVPWPMPVYGEAQPAEAAPESAAGAGKMSRRSSALLAKVTIVVFYVVSCGSERLFQVTRSKMQT